MSTLKLVKRQVVQHKKFQFGTKNALFLYFWVVSLKSSVQKYKSLNLRPNMSFWVFLDYKSEGKSDCDKWNQHPRICRNAKKKMCNTKKWIQFWHQNCLIWVFWAVNLKKYCHIWNQHPLICHKDVFDQNREFWHRVHSLKGPVSTFSKGPLLLKVHFTKYAIWWLTLEAYLKQSQTSAIELLFKNS